MRKFDPYDPAQADAAVERARRRIAEYEASGVIPPVTAPLATWQMAAASAAAAAQPERQPEREPSSRELDRARPAPVTAAADPDPAQAGVTAAKRNGKRPGARAGRDTVTVEEDGTVRGRRLRLTSAAAIKPKPVRWLWEARLPAGAISLIPGREGIGNS
ncbi:MAG TPA: hypothetical protein VIL46_01070, partial [Gemmataceae bacterium]